QQRVTDEITTFKTVLVANPGATISRMLDKIPESLVASNKSLGEAMSGEELADMDLYYHVINEQATPASASELLNALNSLASVEIAYAQPRVENQDIPPVTEINLVGSQGYLNPAPSGINATYAWSYPGG